MATLRRIAPGSAFKVGAIVYGFIGLVLGALCSVLAATSLHVATHSHMLFGRIGIFAVIVCPIVYGLIGGIGAVIAAALYNLASGWVGGVEIDIG